MSFCVKRDDVFLVYRVFPGWKYFKWSITVDEKATRYRYQEVIHPSEFQSYLVTGLVEAICIVYLTI